MRESNSNEVSLMIEKGGVSKRYSCDPTEYDQNGVRKKRTDWVVSAYDYVLNNDSTVSPVSESSPHLYAFDSPEQAEDFFNEWKSKNLKAAADE